MKEELIYDDVMAIVNRHAAEARWQKEFAAMQKQLAAKKRRAKMRRNFRENMMFLLGALTVIAIYMAYSL